MHFYQHELLNGQEADRPLLAGFPWPKDSPLAFIDVRGVESSNEPSKKNEMEARTIASIVSMLMKVIGIDPVK